jgi:hypothetical protein
MSRDDVEELTMWELLAVAAGALLAAYGFFVWRHAHKKPADTTRRLRRAF